jgi:hypothetical protein
VGQGRRTRYGDESRGLANRNSNPDRRRFFISGDGETGCGALQLPPPPLKGNGGFPVTKRPECNFDHLPPNSAETDSEWSCTSSVLSWHGWGRCTVTEVQIRDMTTLYVVRLILDSEEVHSKLQRFQCGTYMYMCVRACVRTCV